jgi:hypothetical protein
MHLPTLGYEISVNLTTALINNQITISLGEIVNTGMFLFPSFQIPSFISFFVFFLIAYSSGSMSTLYIVVYGRVFKTDSVSSYTAGTMTAQVSSTSPTVSQTYTISALPAITASAVVSQFLLFLNKIKFIL